MTPWDQIISGQLLEGIIAGYTNVIGVEWFYALVAFIGFGLIYLKIRDIGVVGIVALLLSGPMLVLMPPDVEQLAYIFMALGAVAIIYKIFMSD